MKINKLTIEIQHDEEGDVYFAKAVELPGCVTEGDTLSEAILMIEDAISLWLSVHNNFNKES